MSWFSRTPLEAVRWAVIDCETSGLDARRARLLSVGAVRVHDGRIDLGGAYSALVRQTEPSEAENILVHGIGGEAQAHGEPLEAVQASLSAFLGDAVPAAFHAGFDEKVLRRHGVRAPRAWLDLARLAAALFPDDAPKLHSLDDWLGRFGIAPAARHDALGDAFAAAQLLLVLLARARGEGLATVEALVSVANDAHWLVPNGRLNPS
ncbi:MAG TPA: 3'-5' exonuclease [Burkholderiales bacterium]|nr:3'-5' exonuclease [Burkholderiales bacterium]